MFCEIAVDHGGALPAAGLTAILERLYTNQITPASKAYAFTQLYKLYPPSSGALLAFHRHSFVVILLSVSGKSSRYHLEGQGHYPSMEELYRAAEEFSEELMGELKKDLNAKTYRVKALRVQVKQPLGEETRIDGRILTFWPWLKNNVDWKSFWGILGTFLTALALIRFGGVTTSTRKAAVLSFILAFVLKLLETTAGYWRSGKMKWSVRW